MPANYVLLEKITVGAAGASSVTFSGIPQTGYTDLVVKASVRSTSSYGGADSMVDDMQLIFNGSSVANYSSRRLAGDGSGTTSTTFSSVTSMQFFYIDGSGATASTFGNTEIYIPNYTSANYKSLSAETVGENNATKAYMNILAGLWSNTSAITSTTLSLVNGSFAQYSTFYLYGVAKLGTTPAIVPYATGGDTIMTDGTYWYHAFLSSGTFTPAKGLSCDALAVAGGGAGGFDGGGGGGAGGLVLLANQSLTSGNNYTVTIGAGASAPNVNTTAVAGSNSSFGVLLTTSGGGGGRGYQENGGNGGSGGGGGNANTVSSNTGGTGNAGSFSPVEGYAGGNNPGAGAANYTSGGGGGAGGVGGNGTAGTSGVAGNGGNGASSYNSISFSAWLTATSTGVGGGLAGGGGGGGYKSSSQTAGTVSNGGGLGKVNVPGSPQNGNAGTANTGGGGGGGSGNSGTGGNGGSGIVIVRYLV